VSPLPFGGPVASAPADLGGHWLYYRLDPAVPTPHRPRRIQLAHAELAPIASGSGEVRVLDNTLEAVLFVEADGVAVAGIDAQGVVVWLVREGTRSLGPDGKPAEIGRASCRARAEERGEEQDAERRSG